MWILEKYMKDYHSHLHYYFHTFIKVFQVAAAADMLLFYAKDKTSYKYNQKIMFNWFQIQSND